MDKIIISDTSCLITLGNVNKLEILRDLFQEVIITKEVRDEFNERLPDWITVMDVKDKQRQNEIEIRLDKGEASSIALALELPNSMLIVDEIKGRKIAESFNIEIIGTIGVLILAKKKDLIDDIIGIIMIMRSQGFRLSDNLLNTLMDSYGKT